MRVRRSLGLTYEEIGPLNKKMIYASLTAYGETGPEAERKGFDAVAYWSRSGLADEVRAPGAPPGATVPGMGDHPTAVALFACIMMGLYKRQLTGKGGMYRLLCSRMGSGRMVVSAKLRWWVETFPRAAIEPPTVRRGRECTMRRRTLG